MMAATSLLALRGVSKSFQVEGSRTSVLADVDLDLRAGEVLLLRGASGSGKSSVIRVAGLLSYPDQGQVLIDGSEPPRGEYSRIRRERIGIVFQNSNLLPGLTVDENLAVAAASSTQEHRFDLLASWGLERLARSRATTVSGGEAQRIAFCRALMNDPEILLLDEPSAGLDAANAGLVRRMILSAKDQGRGVLLASHDEAMASIADSVLDIKEGKVV